MPELEAPLEVVDEPAELVSEDSDELVSSSEESELSELSWLLSLLALELRLLDELESLSELLLEDDSEILAWVAKK